MLGQIIYSNSANAAIAMAVPRDEPSLLAAPVESPPGGAIVVGLEGEG
jgi:hypothetical protein